MSARPGRATGGAGALLLAVALLLAANAPASAQAGEGALGSASDTLALLPALERALAVAPELARSSAEMEAAAAAAGQAEGARLPSVTSSFSVTRFQEPMVVAPLHGFDPAAAPDFDETLVQGRAALTWTVWDGGARGGRIESARALEAAAEAAGAAARQQTLERTVEAYLAVLTARDVRAAQALREEELDAERARVQRFLDEGSAARVELLRANAELSAARADRSAAVARVGLAEAALARHLALEPRTLAGVAVADVALDQASATEPDPGRVDGAHPLVLAMERRAGAARAAASVARAARYPSLSAAGAWNEFGGASSDFTGEWQGGLRVEYPLFTGGARGRAVEEADARVRAAEAEMEAVRRDLALAADRAAAAQDEAQARVEALEDAVLQFEELARVEALALEEGAGVQRDFLRAQAGLYQARAGLAEARRAAVLAGVRRARARGELTLSWIDDHLERVR